VRACLLEIGGDYGDLDLALGGGNFVMQCARNMPFIGWNILKPLWQMQVGRCEKQELLNFPWVAF